MELPIHYILKKNWDVLDKANLFVKVYAKVKLIMNQEVSCMDYS